jgi:hypothetical protein
LAIVPTDETVAGGGGVGGGPFCALEKLAFVITKARSKVAIVSGTFIFNLLLKELCLETLSFDPEFPRHRLSIARGLHHYRAPIQHVFSQCDGKRRRAGTISYAAC